MSQCRMVSKTKFQHSVTTTFFFARFFVKALSLWPFCENLIKLRIFNFFSSVRRMSVEQRINLKFLVRLVKNSDWSTKVASRSLWWWNDVKNSSFEWQRKFKEGREEVEDDHRSGRPSTSRTDENVERARQKVRSDRRLTVRMIADELGVNSERVWRIITEDLCKNATKVAEWRTKGAACASVSKHFGATRNWTQLAEKSCYWRWVMDLRVRSTYQTAEPWMEERIVTKAQKGEGVQVQNQVDAHRFFDVHEIVLAEFLPQGQTINQRVYKNILRRLMRSVRKKRRELWKTRSWLLHHNNAPAHNALGIREFRAKNNIAVLEQPLCSPDLAPCDFFLFPELKEVIKGTRFQDSEAIKTAVTRDLRTIPEESFQKCVEAWQRRLEKCIRAQGDHFKGDML